MKKLLKNDKIIVYEQPSTKRTIIVNNTRYFIQFPTMIFVIKELLMSEMDYYGIHSSYGFFVYGKDELNKIYAMHLPNIYSTGYICLGKKDISELNIEETINEFWNSKFTIPATNYGTKTWNEWSRREFSSIPDVCYHEFENIIKS